MRSCFRLKVCWYWKFLSESDQIWMPKCLRFGWTPKHNPSSHESNIWKRVYSFNIQALQTMPIRVRKKQNQTKFFLNRI
jgi:F-box protein 16